MSSPFFRFAELMHPGDAAPLASRLAMAGATLLLLWVMASWLGRWWAPAPQAAPVLPSPEAGEAVRAIASRHLFQPVGDASGAGPVAVRSDLKLLGVSASVRGRNRSLALLQDANGSPYSALEGEEILPGVILRRVFPDRVEIERGGHRETLSLDSTPSGARSSSKD